MEDISKDHESLVWDKIIPCRGHESRGDGGSDLKYLSRLMPKWIIRQHFRRVPLKTSSVSEGLGFTCPLLG